MGQMVAWQRKRCNLWLMTVNIFLQFNIRKVIAQSNSLFFKFFLNGEAIVVPAVFSPIDTERLKQMQPTCTNKRGRVMILQYKQKLKSVWA